MNYMNLMVLLDGANWFLDRNVGGDRRPVFFDVAQTYPPLQALDRNFATIRAEIQGLLAEKGSIPKYHEVDQMQHYISGHFDADKNWKVFYLYAMGEKPEANRAKCPQTAALLDGIPDLFQAFFSILEGGKSIPAHRGPYRGYLRYHLGLIVPTVDPPSIRVKDQHYTWQEGQSILFDDSWNHEVVNHCASDRVILIVDVRRPMPFVFDRFNRFAEWVMRQVYGKQIVRKLA